MYKNGKMGAVYLRMWVGRMEENDGGGEFN
jgi:hypothetical protein